ERRGRERRPAGDPPPPLPLARGADGVAGDPHRDDPGADLRGLHRLLRGDDRLRALRAADHGDPQPEWRRIVETVLEGRANGSGRSRLHLAPEGLALRRVTGGEVRYAQYEQVAFAEATRKGRGAALSIS